MSADVSMITAEDRYCHSQEYRQGRRVEQWQRGTVARPISITSSTRLSIDWTLRSANLISTQSYSVDNFASTEPAANGPVARWTSPRQTLPRGLHSPQEAAVWAHRTLRAKNSLTEASGKASDPRRRQQPFVKTRRARIRNVALRA